MSVIVNLAPTTETEAVNAMLSAIGVAPIADVNGATQADVEMAVNILRATAKEVQGHRWRFNTEYGYALTAAGTLTVGSVVLNVFTVPTGLASFVLSADSTQRGIDAIIRPSRVYSPGTLVFYDRLRGRDGFPNTEITTLKIDPVWLFDFDKLPESARRYISILAARRFAEQVAGDAELAKFTEKDEANALQALMQDQQERAPVAADGAPQTETEALNLLLISTNQEPVIDVARPLSRPAMEALNLLRATVREVQARGWKFNMEWGYEVAPTTTYEWEYRDDLTETINIFKPPSNLLGFSLNKAPWQQGDYYMDVIIRHSKSYTEGGVSVPVFYDRMSNRDGWTRDYIYIDPIWHVTFEQMPEEAKRYCVVVAARRYATKFVGVNGAAMFSQKDEEMAERALKRAYGDTEDYNIFDNMAVVDAMGGRAFGPSGDIDYRASPGQV